MTEQPAPIPNDRPSLHDELRDAIKRGQPPSKERDRLIAEIDARKQKGLETYGSLLQPFNGREPEVDAFEEAVDLAAYLTQLLAEVCEQDNKVLADDTTRHLKAVIEAALFLAAGVNSCENFRGRNKELKA